MKRMLFLMLAVLAALFALLIAVDVINLETDRADWWTMVTGIAATVFFIVLASVDTSTPASGKPTSQRAAAERALGANRPGPSELPAKPGSLLRPKMILDSTDAATAEDSEIAEIVAEDAEPILDLVALEPDEVDAELQEMIDEEQMEEIAALVRQAEATQETASERSSDAPATPVAPEPSEAGPAEPTPNEAETTADDQAVSAADVAEATDEAVSAAAVTEATDEAEPTPARDLEPAATDEVEPASEPLARIELRLADYDDEALRKVVKDSESLVIAEMVRTGQLTRQGDLTERDVASMVFLAYTSEEMLAELRLRKSLDQTGEVAVTGSSLAPLKNIE